MPTDPMNLKDYSKQYGDLEMFKNFERPYKRIGLPVEAAPTMTFKSALTAYLVNNCMMPSDATQVMETVMADPKNDHMKAHWDQPVTGYPPELLTGLMLTMNGHALTWIDANCPAVFYRAMFVN
jgi:hypothetical protein